MCNAIISFLFTSHKPKRAKNSFHSKHPPDDSKTIAEGENGTQQGLCPEATPICHNKLGPDIPYHSRDPH